MPSRTSHRPPPPPPPPTTSPTTPAPSTARAEGAPPVGPSAPGAPPTPYGVHLDGFDSEPRRPYGVRLGEDLRPPDVEPPPPPDLSVSPPPLRAPRAGELRGEPTPSVMERAIDSFPLAHVIPDATVIPTVSTRTTEVHDGTSDGRIEASRAEARREARGRPDPVLPPPTLPDREAERVDQGLRDAIARGGFCESPAGAGSPDCPPAD